MCVLEEISGTIYIVSSHANHAERKQLRCGDVGRKKVVRSPCSLGATTHAHALDAATGVPAVSAGCE